MFGDIVLFIKEKWKQFWCIHDYKYRDLPANCSHYITLSGGVYCIIPLLP